MRPVLSRLASYNRGLETTTPRGRIRFDSMHLYSFVTRLLALSLLDPRSATLYARCSFTWWEYYTIHNIPLGPWREAFHPEFHGVEPDLEVFSGSVRIRFKSSRFEGYYTIFCQIRYAEQVSILAAFLCTLSRVNPDLMYSMEIQYGGGASELRGQKYCFAVIKVE